MKCLTQSPKSVKRLWGRHFYSLLFLHICPVSALRSTIGVLTIRPIKEIFQWHFRVAACCLSQPGSGGDTCTSFARLSLELGRILHLKYNRDVSSHKKFIKLNLPLKIASLAQSHAEACHAPLAAVPCAVLVRATQ